jgi:hypothetical protein
LYSCQIILGLSSQRRLAVLECGAPLKDSKYMQSFIRIT